MTYIFLDTNSLLHFQDFENINWNDIVKDPDYEIVICPMVLNEIGSVSLSVSEASSLKPVDLR